MASNFRTVAQLRAVAAVAAVRPPPIRASLAASSLRP